VRSDLLFDVLERLRDAGLVPGKPVEPPATPAS
jgi:hypothetical protein